MSTRVRVLTAVVNIRCTPEEKAFVVEQAKLAGMTPSVLGRRRLLEIQVVSREAAVERNELRRLGGLLKQVHKESKGAYAKQTAEILGLIESRLKTLGGA